MVERWLQKAVQPGRWFGLALGLLLCLPLQAHKLKVFATAEGEKIIGQAYFVGGAGAGGAAIRITDTDGLVLAQPEPDAEGNFSYRVNRRMDYRVVADSRDGHLASWNLRADEFSSELPGEPLTEAPVTGGLAAPESAPSASPVPSTASGALTLQQVEAAVARQIRPLREAMQAQEERVRLRDIVGGIGYIIGVAGLGLWWSSRRRRAKP
jgi:nickel transport protein